MKDCILELSDFNLSMFSLALEKNEVFIELLNMYDGGVICEIKLNNIIGLKYIDSMNDEAVLPAYMGELAILKEKNTGIYHLEMHGWLDFSLTSLSCSISYPT